MTELPKEIIIQTFDLVTTTGDFVTRLKMLLTFPYLWEYSKSLTHMKKLLRKWHTTCYNFEGRIERPMPSTMDTNWLNDIIVKCRKKDTKVDDEIVFYSSYRFWMKCRYCGETCVKQCNLL